MTTFEQKYTQNRLLCKLLFSTKKGSPQTVVNLFDFKCGRWDLNILRTLLYNSAKYSAEYNNLKAKGTSRKAKNKNDFYNYTESHYNDSQFELI